MIKKVDQFVKQVLESQHSQILFAVNHQRVDGVEPTRVIHKGNQRIEIRPYNRVSEYLVYYKSNNEEHQKYPTVYVICGDAKIIKFATSAFVTGRMQVSRERS